MGDDPQFEEAAWRKTPYAIDEIGDVSTVATLTLVAFVGACSRHDDRAAYRLLVKGWRDATTPDSAVSAVVQVTGWDRQTFAALLDDLADSVVRTVETPKGDMILWLHGRDGRDIPFVIAKEGGVWLVSPDDEIHIPPGDLPRFLGSREHGQRPN